MPTTAAPSPPSTDTALVRWRLDGRSLEPVVTDRSPFVFHGALEALFSINAPKCFLSTPSLRPEKFPLGNVRQEGAHKSDDMAM